MSPHGDNHKLHVEMVGILWYNALDKVEVLCPFVHIGV